MNAEYHQHLQGLMNRFLNEHPQHGLTEKESDDGKTLNATGLRQVHEQLGRIKGYTYDQIIREWNKRCPNDTW